MTCIIATREGVWADRRVTGSNGVLFRPCRKVVSRGALVAAFCGGGCACSKAMLAVVSGETDLQVLAEMCDGLVVNEKGMWELDAKLAVRAPKSVPFLSHGSGFSEAQAFLRGRGAWSAEDCRAALKYVSTCRFDCGDGMDFRGPK